MCPKYRLAGKGKSIFFFYTQKTPTHVTHPFCAFFLLFFFAFFGPISILFFFFFSVSELPIFVSLSLSPVHRRILRRKKTKMGKTKWWTKSKKKKFVLDSFGDTRPVGERDKLGLYFYNNYITMYTFGLSIPIFTSSPSLFWFCFSSLVDFDRFVIGLFPFFLLTFSFDGSILTVCPYSSHFVCFIPIILCLMVGFSPRPRCDFFFIIENSSNEKYGRRLRKLTKKKKQAARDQP